MPSSAVLSPFLHTPQPPALPSLHVHAATDVCCISLFVVPMCCCVDYIDACSIADLSLLWNKACTKLDFYLQITREKRKFSLNCLDAFCNII